MVNPKKLKIGQKLKIATFLVIILITLFISALYFYVNGIILEKTKDEFFNANLSTLNMVKVSAKTSVKNYLKAVAQENILIINGIYEKYINDKITKDEAIREISEIMLSEKIGKSGYVYVINSQGLVLIHPLKELIGKNISEFAFVKKQINDKKGYAEYEWQNPGETAFRNKVSYTEYFQELDLIVAVTAYKDEFESLIDLGDFREEVLSLKLGEEGYTYIITDKGITKIHPFYKEGTDWYNAKDSRNKEFIKEICDKKNGSISYFLKDSNNKKERKKFVVFNYIPELKWIVASGNYTDEYMKPFKNIKIIIVVIFMILIALYLFQEILLEKIVLTPIRNLISAIHMIKEKNVHTKLKIKNNDEIGELSNEFNILMDSLKNHENHLEKMVKARTMELNTAYEELENLNHLNERKEKFLETLFETIPFPVFYKNEHFRYIRCNSAFEKFLGKSKKEICGKTVYSLSQRELADIYHQKDEELLKNSTFQRYETVVKNSAGQLRNVIFNKAVCFLEDKKIGIVGIVEDVTELKDAEKLLKEQTIRDALTGLYNKRGLEEFGNSLFSHAVRNKNEVAVFMIDLDFFKLYNDRYGHPAGDKCLESVAKAIGSCCHRSIDIVGRYGGEEFLALLTDIDKTGAAEVAEKMFSAVKNLGIKHLDNKNYEVVTVSIGVYIAVPQNTEDIAKFTRNADDKLYLAKSKGKGLIEI